MNPFTSKSSSLRSIAVLFVALLLLASSAFAGSHSDKAQKDIVDTAVAAGSFQTLAAALGAAGLVETLKGDGPFTVFAPTDEAFKKLPAGVVETLLKPENKAALTAVLTYHVAAGKLVAADALKAGKATTVEGSTVTIRSDYGTAKVNNAKIVQTDIMTSNGVIHVIDSVLLPPNFTVPSSAPMSFDAGPRDLIKLAIDRGVPMYNRGDRDACAAIYEVTARNLLASWGDSLDRHAEMALTDALASVMHSGDQSANAWTLRRALDRVDARLAHQGHDRMMMAAR